MPSHKLAPGTSSIRRLPRNSWINVGLERGIRPNIRCSLPNGETRIPPTLVFVEADAATF